MYHRFGVIPAAVSTATVQPGRELLCHYNVEYHEGAPWYQVSHSVSLQYSAVTN